MTDIDKNKLFNFANICVSRLGDIVREMKKEGLAIGMTEDEIKKVWLTTFSMFPKE